MWYRERGSTSRRMGRSEHGDLPAWRRQRGREGTGLDPTWPQEKERTQPDTGLTPEGGLAVQPSSAVAVRVSIRVSGKTQEEKKNIR